MYAVLVPVVTTEDGDALLMEVRSAKVRQPGEVCFPGGRMEDGETPVEAAVRETCEELGISADRIEVIRVMDQFSLNDGRVIHPVTARLDIAVPDELSISADEVAEVFLLPAKWLCAHEPARYVIGMTAQEDMPELLRGYMAYYGTFRKYRNDIYETDYYEYEGHAIWGLTARIIRQLREGMDSAKGDRDEIQN